MKKLFFISTIATLFSASSLAQNVGIGTITPASKLHIKGSADASQLIIDANSIQSNTNPLIKLRKSDGTDLMWIHSDDITNSFIGLNAGRVNNATGGAMFNTFIGSRAGYSNTTGYQNSANGSNTLYSNTTGAYNNANGEDALFYNSSGNYNNANGLAALFFNTTGIYNNAVGAFALLNNTTGNGNSADGSYALYYNTTGVNNTALGYNAGCNNGTVPTNFTAIGYNAGHVGSGSNTIEIGNSSVTYIGGQVGWSVFSDGRIKDNVVADVPGLAFISRLRPVTYNLNIHRQNEMCGIADTSKWKGKYDIEKITQTGFIAQEVEQAAIESNYNFNGVQKPKNDHDLYSLNYSSFVVPLVKAVQEQQQIIETQKSDIENQEKRIEVLETKVSGLTKTVSTLMHK